MPEPLNVLFLCTGNSARSIIAEAIIDREGRGAFKGYSAGSMPKGKVHPRTIALLQRSGYRVDGLRSKSWEEFAQEGAPRLDFVITVCDSAAGEVCPVWPGQPITGHWGIPDPAAAEGTEAERAFAFSEAYRMLHQRIGLFLSLRFGELDRATQKQRIDEIGRTPEPGAT